MLDDLFGDNSSSSSDSLATSLSDIANGLLTGIAKSAAGAAQGAVEGSINNAPRSSNTAPTPDVAAAAARPGVSTFVNAKAFGVSIPILLVGAVAVIYLIRR